MKKLLTFLLTISLFTAHSCSEPDTGQRPSVAVTLETPERVEVYSARVLCFDRRGILAYGTACNGSADLSDITVCFTPDESDYTIIGFVNHTDFDFGCELVEGTTNLSSITLDPKEEKIGSNPFLWFGRSQWSKKTGHVLNIKMQKAESIGIGITVNPWQVREVEVEFR